MFWCGIGRNWPSATAECCICFRFLPENAQSYGRFGFRNLSYSRLIVTIAIGRKVLEIFACDIQTDRQRIMVGLLIILSGLEDGTRRRSGPGKGQVLVTILSFVRLFVCLRLSLSSVCLLVCLLLRVRLCGWMSDLSANALILRIRAQSCYSDCDVGRRAAVYSSPCESELHRTANSLAVHVILKK